VQAGRAHSLMRANQRRKHERRGLEAIFTPPNEKRNSELLTGAAGIIVGLAFSILALFRAQDPQALAGWGQAIYYPLALGAIGLLLLTCGGGTIIFAITHYEPKLENTMVSPVSDHSQVDFSGDTKAPHGTPRMERLRSRIGAVAMIESLVLVALYSGFVQEYESNLTMQAWVRSNLLVGQSVLNWEAVLIFSVVLGLLVLQFLPGRFFSE
jgi:hypothetical protein